MSKQMERVKRIKVFNNKLSIYFDNILKEKLKQIAIKESKESGKTVTVSSIVQRILYEYLCNTEDNKKIEIKL